MRRWFFPGAIVLVALASPSWAGPTRLVPERTLRPVPPVSWSAFLPVHSDSLPELPMRGAIRPSRWLGLEHALGMHTVPAESTALPIAETSAEADSAGLFALGTDSSATGITLTGESPAFLAAWSEAVARAREDDAVGCREALRGASPRTPGGEDAVARLAFAAAVARGDRSGADSLAVRIEAPDASRSSRLEAWRYLAAGQGRDADQALAGIPESTPGIQAARAMAAWQAGSLSPDAEALAWTQVEGLPRVALALVAAAHQPDPARVLDRVPETDVPPDWKPTYEALRHPGASAPPEEGDAARYQKAALAFTAGNDAEAKSALDDLLAGWPASTTRPSALLLRAHLRLAAGDRDEANSDLRALERLALSAEMEVRTTVCRAFWEAQNGFFPEAQSALGQALAQDYGAKMEGEIRFDRVRISRMAGDKPAVDAGILELEEAFPKEPWASRARSDTRVLGWREPWRSVPGSTASVLVVTAPTQGPWGMLLWGERVLTREADALSGTSSLPATSAEPSPGSPAGVTASATTMVPSGRLGYLEIGVGDPAFGSLGAGIGGKTGGLLFRAEGGQTIGQANNDLPDYRRTSWEIAAARISTPIMIGVALEGTGRTDDGAPNLGLNADAVDAYAWGIRGDLSEGNPDVKGFGASVSRMPGKIDAGGSGRWTSTETWFEVRGALPAGRSRWEGRWTSTHFDQEAPGGSEDNWLHDLRLVMVRPSGWYLGGRAAIYRDRGLLLPVIGVEKRLHGWEAWLRGEPALRVPSFRENFVVNGDWNVPTLGLQAERRTIDVEGGLRAGTPETDELTASGKLYEVDELRTWEKSGGLWVERSMNDANGFELSASGTKHLGDFRASASGTYRKLRAEDRQVPYVPVVEGNLELAYDTRAWRAATRLLGVDGREDDFQNAYGSFLRWDLEGALKLAAPGFLPSNRIEIALRLENLTDVADRRWPGVPGYGRGIFLGLRTLHGRPSGT